MNKIFVTGAVLVLGLSGSVFASCSDPQVTGLALTNLVSGNTICATQGSEKWAEQHRPTGELWDYKKGAGDPVDPTSKVGSWSISGEKLNHTYDVTYSYSVHNAGSGTYTLCPANINATFKIGATNCGF